MGNRKDTSAFAQGARGTLSAPAMVGGSSAPIVGDTGTQDRVIRAVNSKNPRPESNASDAAVRTLHLSVVLVATGLVLLWVLGGVVFKNARV